MSGGLTDTSHQTRDVQLEVLRTLGPERRSLLAAEWSDELRAIAMQGIRDRHRGLDERRVLLEYARLTLGEPLWARELEIRDLLERLLSEAGLT